MRPVVLLLTLLLPAAARAQSPVLSVRGVSFGLSVADMAASTKWYVEKLGLHVTMQLPRNDATRASVTLQQGGGLTVELVHDDDAVPLGRLLPANKGAISLHGIAKVGVTVDDFDRALAALRARGVDIAYGPFPKRTDQPANVIIRDNAGNLIQIAGR